MAERILIRCDKCGSTNVVDKEVKEQPKIVVLTMDEYMEKNKARSLFPFSTQFVGITGVSHMEKRVLRCRDCGNTRVWEQVVYT